MYLFESINHISISVTRRATPVHSRAVSMSVIRRVTPVYSRDVSTSVPSVY